MKLKFAKLIIPCLASLACLAGCGGNDAPAGYYSGYNLDQDGAFLRLELQRLCFDKHSNYIYYSKFSTYCAYTADHISCDAVSENSKKNQMFYTAKEDGGSGTREHVWPCASSANLWVHKSTAGTHYVDGNKYAGGGSDLYHVRPSTSSVNTARGDSKFVDFKDPEFDSIRKDVVEVGDGGKYKLKIYGAEKTKSGGYQYADKAEPADEFKGDIARILLYVWVHYGYAGEYYDHKDMIGNLNLCDVMGYGSDIERTYQKLAEWNKKDPPSAIEKLRNNTVQKMQGNRNMFVDYPDLVNRLLEVK